MIKKLRVTVDAKPYDVTVEIPDEAAPAVGAAAPPPVAAPAPAPVSAPASPAPAPAPAGKTSAGPWDVPSPLMGRVVAIDVKVGQEVTQGQQLITVETMKMNTFVLSPKAGKVAEIRVAVGEGVEEGSILARIA
jgi:biotin carboxyl carrier protein